MSRNFSENPEHYRRPSMTGVIPAMPKARSSRINIDGSPFNVGEKSATPGNAMSNNSNRRREPQPGDPNLLLLPGDSATSDGNSLYGPSANTNPNSNSNANSNNNLFSKLSMQQQPSSNHTGNIRSLQQQQQHYQTIIGESNNIDGNDTDPTDERFETAKRRGINSFFFCFFFAFECCEFAKVQKVQRGDNKTHKEHTKHTHICTASGVFNSLQKTEDLMRLKERHRKLQAEKEQFELEKKQLIAEIKQKSEDIERRTAIFGTVLFCFVLCG